MCGKISLSIRRCTPEQVGKEKGVGRFFPASGYGTTLNGHLRMRDAANVQRFITTKVVAALLDDFPQSLSGLLVRMGGLLSDAVQLFQPHFFVGIGRGHAGQQAKPLRLAAVNSAKCRQEVGSREPFELPATDNRQPWI